MNRHGVSKTWRMPDELWSRMEPLLPRVRRSRKGGRHFCLGGFFVSVAMFDSSMFFVVVSFGMFIGSGVSAGNGVFFSMTV